MEQTEQKQVGAIIRYDRASGRGNIKGRDGVTYFVYHSNIKCDPLLLKAGAQVKFFGRTSDYKKDRLDAYEVEYDYDFLTKFPNVSIISENRNLDPDQWPLWSDPAVREKYPDLEKYFETISREIHLSIIELKLDDVQTPVKQLMPIGAWLKEAAWRYQDLNRAGAIAGFGDGEVILIIQAFKKSNKPHANDWCWRAFGRHSGYLQIMEKMHQEWYENMYYFFGELRWIITEIRKKAKRLARNASKSYK